MSQSRLIELSYYDPARQTRLSAYADTVVLDQSGEKRVICAIRFGGYPEMVQAMSDAIYGGAVISATQNGNTKLLQGNVKAYRRQMSHDGIYAVATLIVNDDEQKECDPKTLEELDEEQMNTPAGMVRPDRGNGARETLKWCRLTA